MDSLLLKYRAEKEGQVNNQKYTDLKCPLTPEEVLRKRVEDIECNRKNNIILQSTDSIFGIKQPVRYINTLTKIPTKAQADSIKITTSFPSITIDPSQNDYVENDYIDNYFN